MFNFLDIEVSKEGVETCRVDGCFDDGFGAVEKITEEAHDEIAL